MAQLRGARPASSIFDQIHRAGGYTQINHPTIYPNQVPTFAQFCRGCAWDYSPRQTDYSKVDAIEIATGTPGVRSPVELGPNPFTVTAIDFYQRALQTGNHIAAVGSSDSHDAGKAPDPITDAPVGTATTVVHADELSEAGLADAIRAGHTYVKVFGNSGPDLRFTASAGGKRAIFGDTLRSGSADMTARVIGANPSLDLFKPGPYLLDVLRNGAITQILPVTSADQTFHFRAARPGRYQLQLTRATGIAAYSSPIYLQP
jgi:hypothetical protein